MDHPPIGDRERAAKTVAGQLPDRRGKRGGQFVPRVRAAPRRRETADRVEAEPQIEPSLFSTPRLGQRGELTRHVTRRRT